MGSLFSRAAPVKIEIEYCHTWSFKPKAAWFGETVLARVATLKSEGFAVEATAEQIEQKGKMFVRVDGAQVYSKGGFRAENPQPTPEEVDELVTSLTAKAGKALPLSDGEKAAFLELHEAQIKAGKSKH